MITPELWTAYTETDYVVDADPSITLKVGATSTALDELLGKKRSVCAAFITAWNPDSKQLPIDENNRRQAELLEELKSRGLTVIGGRGRHPSNGWEAEESMLVFDLQVEAARKLCKKYGQLAFVVANRFGPVTLIETAAG